MQLFEVMDFASRCRTVLPKALHIVVEFLELQVRLGTGILLILDYLFELRHFMVKSSEGRSFFLKFTFRLPVTFLSRN